MASKAERGGHDTKKTGFYPDKLCRVLLCGFFGSHTNVPMMPCKEIDGETVLPTGFVTWNWNTYSSPGLVTLAKYAVNLRHWGLLPDFVFSQVANPEVPAGSLRKKRESIVSFESQKPGDHDFADLCISPLSCRGPSSGGSM